MTKFFLWFAASIISISVFAQQIRYNFSAPNAIHHEADGFNGASPELWKTHGKTEIPYTIKDLEIVLAKVSGDKTYAIDFFRKYIMVMTL